MSAPLGNIGPPIKSHLQGYPAAISPAALNPQMPGPGTQETYRPGITPVGGLNGSLRPGQPPSNYSYGPGPGTQYRPAALGPPGSMPSMGPPGRPSLPSTPNSAFGLSPAPSPGPRPSSASFPTTSTIGPPLPGLISNPIGPPSSTFSRTPGSSVGPSPAPSPSPLLPTPTLNAQFTSQANHFTPSQQTASLIGTAPPTLTSTSVTSGLPPAPSIRPPGPSPNILNGGSFNGARTPQNQLQGQSTPVQNTPGIPAWQKPPQGMQGQDQALSQRPSLSSSARFQGPPQSLGLQGPQPLITSGLQSPPQSLGLQGPQSSATFGLQGPSQPLGLHGHQPSSTPGLQGPMQSQPLLGSQGFQLSTSSGLQGPRPPMSSAMQGPPPLTSTGLQGPRPPMSSGVQGPPPSTSTGLQGPPPLTSAGIQSTLSTTGLQGHQPYPPTGLQGPPLFPSAGLQGPPRLPTEGMQGPPSTLGFQRLQRPQPPGQQNNVALPNGPSTFLSGPPLNGPSTISNPPLHPPMPGSVQSSVGTLPPPPLNGAHNNMPPPPMSNGISPQQGLYNGPTSLPPTSTTSFPPMSSAPGLQPPRPSAMPPPIQQPNNMNSINSRLGNLSLQSGMEPVDLLQNRHILPPQHLPPPKPRLAADIWNQVNCSPDIFRCTLTKIPETEALLRKARLPLGILIHPFKDLSHLPVIQCTTIVRCRQCRTYINPFVQFVDQRRWRCNICYRVNELPEEFLYDPVSKSYGDPSRRPECKSSTIEFIAPSEYMLRPPQPAVYVFCLDTSRQAIESGYLKVFCEVVLDEIDKLPGDARTQIAFLTYDRSVHFYSMPEGSSRPTQLVVSDVDDIFLPSPSDLLVNLHDCRNLVLQLLEDLPSIFNETHETESALGAALLAAFKLASPSGGRITVFQHILPKVGPGALPNRELSSDNKSSETSLLGPATDFYKKMSLDCSGQQVAVDLFALGSQYQDIASLSGMSKFSAGQIQYFPGYHVTQNPTVAAKFECALRRYLTRKIGFEAVMRIRCTRGLALHTFHGNFFVRSTDLLALPNINPDAGFGIQVAIEDDLRDSREVSFQAALLYTSSKGERRIRVHTLCVPTSANLNDVINGADERAIVGMLAKFAADRAVTDSIGDAKEGLVVSCVDTIETYRTQASMSIPNGLLISQSLKLLPLNVLACLRSMGLRSGMKLDERSFNFVQFKTLPLKQLLQNIYPDLYRVDNLSDEGALREEGGDSSDEDGPTEIMVPQPPRLQLSFERVSATGMYLMDLGDTFYLYLSRGLHAYVLEKCFGVTKLQDINESLVELPELENSESEKLRTFVHWLNGQKPYQAPIKLIREDGKFRHLFVERMIEDRMDNSFSYFEFLQHIKQQIK